MQISIKELKPNPFRPDLPFNEVKIKQLEANIKSTGFWDNIVCRRHGDDKYELAYGHHRLQALKNCHIKEIDIPVKPLTDAIMLQMMAQENMEEMEGSPIWAMEIVKTTYFFLNQKQDLIVVTGDDIAKFLEWGNKRVADAMANLRATGDIPQSKKSDDEQPAIKREIFAALPSQKHATEFRKAVKDIGPRLGIGQPQKD